MKKKKTTEINQQRNEKYRYLEKLNYVPKLIILAGVSLVVSVVFAIIAVIAMRDANAATAIATTWQTMYKETETECRLAQLSINDFRIALFNAGIELEHTGETP